MSKWSPACMSGREYEDWQAAAMWAHWTTGQTVRVPSVCHDCTLAFRSASREAGICNTQSRLPQMDARREAVAALRRTGLTWAQVGARLGIGGGKARDAIRFHRHMLEKAA